MLRVGAVAAPRRHGRRGGRPVWPPDALLVLDADDLRAPIRDWDDLRTAVGADRADALTLAHQAGLSRVLLTYRRRGIQGVRTVALRDAGDLDRKISGQPASETPANLRRSVRSIVQGLRRRREGS